MNASSTWVEGLLHADEMAEPLPRDQVVNDHPGPGAVGRVEDPDAVRVYVGPLPGTAANTFNNNLPTAPVGS
jgi:hypothetical protein